MISYRHVQRCGKLRAYKCINDVFDYLNRMRILFVIALNFV